MGNEMTVQGPARHLLDRLNSPRQPIGAPGDIVFIRELELDAHIGAYEEERRAPQTLQFDLEIGTSRNRACLTDRLADTIDYAQVVSAIRALLARRRFHLLEALAEAVAQLVLEEFGARWVSLAIAKTGIVPGAKFVGVAITRDRQSIGNKRSGSERIGRRSEAAGVAQP